MDEILEILGLRQPPNERPMEHISKAVGSVVRQFEAVQPVVQPVKATQPARSQAKAIETHFEGYRFRSRLEARWAVYFSTLEVRYEYEKEGFDLGGGLRYLPDFYLPDIRMVSTGLWVEVKGALPTPIEQKKAQALADQTDDIVMLAFIPPWEQLSNETKGNWVYYPNQKEPLHYGWFADCWFCGQLGLAPFGDPRKVTCGCLKVATTLANNMTIKEIQAWVHPHISGLVLDLKTGKMGDLKDVVGPSVHVQRAALKAKQARFEHGEKG